MNTNGRSNFVDLFTTQQRHIISLELGEYATEKVQDFIKHLELLCAIKVYRNKHTVNGYINSRINLLQYCIKVSDKLDQLVNKDYDLIELDVFMECYINLNTELHDYCSIINVVPEAIQLKEHILSFISRMNKILEYEQYIKKTITNDKKGRAGRRKANDDGFYTEIASTYNKYIDTPTSSKEGHFENIIKIVNNIVKSNAGSNYTRDEILGQDSDPSRAIRQAIRDMKRNPNSYFMLPCLLRRSPA